MLVNACGAHHIVCCLFPACHNSVPALRELLTLSIWDYFPNFSVFLKVSGGTGSVDSKSKSFGDDDGFEDVKRNKKKKKMQKVDPNLLGFQCNADPELLNRDGDLESVANALAAKAAKK